jgi:hypothetical protein
MKKNTCALALIIVLARCFGSPAARAESFCLDFRWNPNPANLVLYDFSILDLQAQPDLGPGHAAGKKFFSYLSVGEIAGDAFYLADVKARGVKLLSYNSEWRSYYPDLSDVKWADYVVQVLAPKIVAKGFDGFFLDTVDAVETMMALQPGRAAEHRSGMVNLITRLKNAFPTKQIILNRGFAVFDSVKHQVKGMLVEELFQRDDYSSRSADGIAQLLARIAPVTAAGKPVYIVYYVPSSNLALAQETARRIANLGFHPVIIPRGIDGTVLAPAPKASAPPVVPAPAPAPSPAPPATDQPATETTASGVPKLGVRRSTSTTATVIGFAAQPNQKYVIQYRPGLGSKTWTTWRQVTPVTSARRVEFYDFDNGGLRFYRLAVLP